MGKLSGEVAIVTGGARGIGRALAHRLADLGADVAILDIDLHSYKQFKEEEVLMTADTTVEECQAKGVRAIGIEVDCTDQPAVQAAVDQVAKELGSPTICIADCGGGGGTMAQTTASTLDWKLYHEILDRNLNATLYTTNAVAPYMKEAKRGKIVTLASIGGIGVHDTADYVPYSVAKAGIILYTKYLAEDLGKYGINVNCLAPGYIATGRLNATIYGTEEGKKRAYASALRRFGTVEECADCMEFLVTDQSSYVSGLILEMSGQTTGKIHVFGLEDSEEKLPLY